MSGTRPSRSTACSGTKEAPVTTCVKGCVFVKTVNSKDSHRNASLFITGESKERERTHIIEFHVTNTFSRAHLLYNVRACCNRKQSFIALATSGHICQPFTLYQYCHDSNISHPEKLLPERKTAERLCMYLQTYMTTVFQRTA
jgi:hypothetical protein